MRDVDWSIIRGQLLLRINTNCNNTRACFSNKISFPNTVLPTMFSKLSLSCGLAHACLGFAGAFCMLVCALMCFAWACVCLCVLCRCFVHACVCLPALRAGLHMFVWARMCLHGLVWACAALCRLWVCFVHAWACLRMLLWASCMLCVHLCVFACALRVLVHICVGLHLLPRCLRMLAHACTGFAGSLCMLACACMCFAHACAHLHGLAFALRVLAQASASFAHDCACFNVLAWDLKGLCATVCHKINVQRPPCENPHKNEFAILQQSHCICKCDATCSELHHASNWQQQTYSQSFWKSLNEQMLWEHCINVFNFHRNKVNLCALCCDKLMCKV